MEPRAPYLWSRGGCTKSEKLLQINELYLLPLMRPGQFPSVCHLAVKSLATLILLSGLSYQCLSNFVETRAKQSCVKEGGRFLILPSDPDESASSAQVLKSCVVF